MQKCLCEVSSMTRMGMEDVPPMLCNARQYFALFVLSAQICWTLFFGSLLLAVFYLLYNSSAVQHLLLGGASASSEQPVHSTDPNRPKWARQSLSSPLPEYQHYPQQWHSATAAEEAAAAFSPVDVKLSGRRLHHATDDPVSSSMGSSPVMQQSGDSSSYQGSAGFTAEAGVRNIGRVASSRDGDPMLTTPQRALRAGFYIWVNVINLIGELNDQENSLRYAWITNV